MKNPQKRNKSSFSLFPARIGGKNLRWIQDHYHLLIQKNRDLKGLPSDKDLIITGGLHGFWDMKQKNLSLVPIVSILCFQVSEFLRSNIHTRG
jgi:hypothetical protein